MTVYDWALNINKDNNAYTKKLAGKLQRDMATEEDLKVAKRTIKYYFIVGVMNQMEESVKRFNIVFGINDTTADKCMESYFKPKESGEVKKRNSNPHPKVSRFIQGRSFFVYWSVKLIHVLLYP